MRRLRFALLLGGWAAVVAMGTCWTVNYELTPAPAARPLQRWPVESSLAHDPQRSTLLMFVHPQCPCSREPGRVESLDGDPEP